MLHANERVTNEVLLEAVWGSDAGGSMKRLQVAVMRLRKALEPLGPETLRTVTGGYQLAVGAGELDAEVFVCLVREGTAAFEGDDPELGLRLLRAADGLWRGETLADLRSRRSRRTPSGASTSSAWRRSRPVSIANSRSIVTRS